MEVADKIALYQTYDWDQLEQLDDPESYDDRVWIQHYLKYFGNYRPIPEGNFREIFLNMVYMHLDGRRTEWGYHDTLLNHRSYAVRALKINGHCLKHLNINLKDDRELNLIAVRNKGLALKYSPFIHDMEIVIEAVTNNGLALEFAHPDLQANSTVVDKAVTQNGLALKFAKLQDDRNLVKIAVRQNGHALEWARCPVDRELVMDALNHKQRKLPDFEKSYLPLQFIHRDLTVVINEFVTSSVRHYASPIQFANQFWNDRELMTYAIHRNPYDFSFMDDSLKDQNLVRKIILREPYLFRYIPEPMKEDREFIISLVKYSGVILAWLPNFKSDPEIVRLAVQTIYWAILFADPMYRKDTDICRLVLQTLSRKREYPNILSNPTLYFDAEILSNDAFMREAILDYNLSLKYASDRLRRDPDFVTQAVSKYSGNFVYSLIQTRELLLKALPTITFEQIPQPFRNDLEIIRLWVTSGVNRLNQIPFPVNRELITIAIKYDPNNLYYSAVRHDPQFIMIAVEHGLNYLNSATISKLNPDQLATAKKLLTNRGIIQKDLNDDRESILTILKGSNKISFFNLPFRHRDDLEIATLAVKQKWTNLKHVSDRLKSNRYIVSLASHQNIKALRFAHKSIRGDRDFILDQVRKNGHALQYSNLRYDHEVVLEAVKQNGLALQYALIQTDDIVLAAVADNGNTLQYINHKTKNLVLRAVKRDGNALRYAPMYSDDFEVAKTAVTNRWTAIKFVSDRLRKDPEIRIYIPSQYTLYY